MSLYGIDESKWQGTLDGQDFAIVKATEGTTYVDPTCDTKYQQNKADGKLLGVYHYAGMGDPVAEADFFVNNIQGYIGEAILALDFETHTDVNWASIWLDHVHARTNVWPLIYMSASAVNAVDWSTVSSHDGLWEAGYPTLFNVPNPPTPEQDGRDMPYASGSWPFAVIWQYTSSAGTLDRDIAYMDAAAWHKYAQGDIAPPPDASPAPQPDPTPTPVPTPEPTPDPVPTEPTPPVEPPVVVPPVEEPTPVVVTTPSKYATLKDAALRVFHTFWQTFVATFGFSALGLTSNLLNIHTFSDAKSAAVAFVFAAGASILSAAKSTWKLYQTNKKETK